jgi:hypothetical protein
MSAGQDGGLMEETGYKVVAVMLLGEQEVGRFLNYKRPALVLRPAV